MDYFSFLLNGFTIISQSIMHIFFTGHLTGKKQRVWHFVAYLILVCMIEQLFTKLSFPALLAIGVEMIALYGVNRLLFQNQRFISWSATVFAVYISQFSFGIVNSIEAVLFPSLIGKPLLYILIICATLIALVICAFCYIVVLKLLSFKENSQTPNIGLLLFPSLFFLAAELYIIQTSYSELSYIFSLAEYGKHLVLLSMQLLGLGGLFFTLYAYQRICHNFKMQETLTAVTLAAEAQKTYISEAKMRYEQTKAFRHDIKNHLLVLDGLLKNGKLEESRAYLKKLETVSNSLSFPYQTGNPVVDILLGEKAGLAKINGIEVEVSLILPRSSRIDDFDLCVIFSNALDNAISACKCIQGTTSIHICGEQQGDFYMLEFTNTCSKEPLSPSGTGLSNIKAVAEKYHGAILTEKVDTQFHLNVLLNISLHGDDSSRHIY